MGSWGIARRSGARALAAVTLTLAWWGGLAAAEGPRLMPPHPSVLQQIRVQGYDSVTAVSLARLAARQRARGVNRPQPIRAPVTGTRPAIVLLIDFPDLPHDPISTPEGYRALLFSSGVYPSPGSMRDFYQKNSRGAFDIDPAQVDGPWRRAAHPHPFYADGDGQPGTGDDYGFGAYPNNAQGLVVEAVLAADPSVDFSSFARDGVVQGLFVVHAGRGAETDPSHADWIWSHMWALGSYGPIVDGVRVDSYSMEPEDTWAPGDSTMGVFAHEYGHVLGLPDLYDTDYTSEGLGNWSLMAGGSWGADGASPAYLDAWSRVQLGWANVVDPIRSLPGAQVPAAERTGTVFRLPASGAARSEYFLLENRQRVSGDFDAALPGDGLLLYHVDETASQDDDWHPLVMVEQADGRWDLQYALNWGDTGDPYPGSSGNRRVDGATLPSTQTYAGADSGITLSGIGDSQDVATVDIGIGPTVPALAVDPTSLIFLVTSGVAPPPQTVTISNTGSGTVAWTARTDADWLHISPAAGATNASALVSVDASRLAFGTTTGHLTIDGGAGTSNSPQTVTVTVSSGLAPGWPRTTGGPVQSSPALADLDGDGQLEVVVGSDDGNVYAWHYDGTPVTGWPQPTGGQVGSSPAVVDFDDDGEPEVIAGSRDGKLYVWRHGGQLLPGWPRQVEGQIRDVAPAVADLDGDGRLEVIVASEGRSVSAWRADGTSPVGWPRTVEDLGVTENTPALADLDGDGKPEVVLGTNTGTLYAWTPPGALLGGWPKAFSSAFFASAALGDIDGDGKAEVVADNGDFVYAWNGDGTALIGWAQQVVATLFSSPALGDLDGDGAPDVVTGTWGEADSLFPSGLYAWSGAGTLLGGWPATLGGTISSSPALADLDGDGKPEVVVGCNNNRVYAFHGDGTPVAGWPLVVGGPVGTSSAALADMNGDGRLEVAIGCSDGKVYLWSCDDATADARPWPMFRRDLRRTGQYRAPSFLVVTADPASGGTASGGGFYASGAQAAVAATPAADWRFESWSGPVADPGQAATTVAMAADARVVAHFVLASDQLNAEFAATPVGGPEPLAVVFHDMSSGGPTAWTWSFGDGQTASDQNPAHLYRAAGLYTVSLTVKKESASDTETKPAYITVSVGPPTADFSAAPRTGTAPLTVQFADLSTKSPGSWLWAFGDGLSDTVQHPAHTYQSAGSYTVSLTVTNGGGTDTKEQADFVTVAPPAPDASFRASPREGPGPLVVQFIDTSDNEPTSWRWEFGDGTAASEQNPVHTYTAPGAYTVTLTATNTVGSGRYTAPGFITVFPPAPVASFTAAPLEGVAPLAVQCTDLSQGAPTAWQWSFGDGTTSTQPGPSHTYERPGAYVISLTVTNAGGSSTRRAATPVLVTFPDVPLEPEEFWALDQVIGCVAAGVVAGYPDGLYHPTDIVTRDQMAVYVARALVGGDAHVPTPSARSGFPDVPPDHWAYRYVEFCRADRIVQGYPDGNYAPANPVDRGQMAIYVTRAIVNPTGEDGLSDYTPPPTPSFPDVAPDYYAYKYIEYIKAHAIAQGYPDGLYHPSDTVTRDQMAVYVARAFKLAMPN